MNTSNFNILYQGLCSFCHIHYSVGAMKTRQLPSIIFVLLWIFCFSSKAALACPLVDGFPDINCDTKIDTLSNTLRPRLKFVGVGDSITFGRRDLPDNRGGFIKRLGIKYPDAEIVNLAKPGTNTKQIFSRVKSARIRALYQDADVIFLLGGVNNYWAKSTPKEVRNDLINIRRYLRSHSSAIVLVGKLTPTRRGFQQPFVNAVNKALKGLANYDFSRIGKNLISSDRIHPSPAGYDAMTEVVVRYLTALSARLQSNDYKDSDNDGIADKFEVTRFGTDPANADTDGDFQSDGDEVFYLGTDPLTPNPL